MPKRFAEIEERQVVWISLKTDSETEAQQRSDAAWASLIEGWEAKLAGDTSDAEARFEAARRLAQTKGYRYLPMNDITKLPLDKLVDRIEAISRSRAGRPDMREAAAMLGGAEKPGISVSRALDLYWSLAKDRTHGKSEDQLRRWRNPRKKAMRNFIAVVGDRQIDELTRDDMLDFRDWWIERLEREGLTPNSANNDLSFVTNILKTVNIRKRLGLDLPVGDLRVRDDAKRTRPPFSVTWITNKLLAPGALKGLNTEARCILLGMVNTGYRPSEGAGLLPEHIRLDVEVPHISIEPVGRQLKSQYSEREIPLAGVSLQAFLECPGGFPRYRGRDRISAVINKFLRENGLLETDKHTLYSLRHSFEDRMLDADVDERIRRDLFGHALNRERYGRGATLEHKARIIESIAL